MYEAFNAQFPEGQAQYTNSKTSYMVKEAPKNLNLIHSNTKKIKV